MIRVAQSDRPAAPCVEGPRQRRPSPRRLTPEVWGSGGRRRGRYGVKKGPQPDPLGGPTVGPGEEGAADEIREGQGGRSPSPGTRSNHPLVGQRAARARAGFLGGARQEQGIGSGRAGSQGGSGQLSAGSGLKSPASKAFVALSRGFLTDLRASDRCQSVTAVPCLLPTTSGGEQTAVLTFQVRRCA